MNDKNEILNYFSENEGILNSIKAPARARILSRS